MFSPHLALKMLEIGNRHWQCPTTSDNDGIAWWPVRSATIVVVVVVGGEVSQWVNWPTKH
jgi:hypothetical protein